MSKTGLTQSEIETFLYTSKLSYNFEQLEKITDKWGFIRQVYIENLPEIMKLAKKDKQKFSKVYLMNWRSYFSPIELIAWNSLRDYGRIAMYPQFPLFNYFIDFANPFLRIGLELDGKDHDKEKDLERDELLFEYGWTIFRVTGKEANNLCPNLEEIEEKELIADQKVKAITDWLLNSVDGVVYALRYWYFIDKDEQQRLNPLFYHPENIDNKQIDISSIVKQTLKMHCNSNIEL